MSGFFPNHRELVAQLAHVRVQRWVTAEEYAVAEAAIRDLEAEVVRLQERLALAERPILTAKSR